LCAIEARPGVEGSGLLRKVTPAIRTALEVDIRAVEVVVVGIDDVDVAGIASAGVIDGQ